MIDNCLENDMDLFAEIISQEITLILIILRLIYLFISLKHNTNQTKGNLAGNGHHEIKSCAGAVRRPQTDNITKEIN